MPRRIVIADDHSDMLETMLALFEVNGYDALTARTGEDALELCLKFRPEAAIIDIAMPSLNGFDVAREVRRRALGIRLIAFTAWDLPAVRSRAEAVGFDVFLAKPVSVRQVMLAVRRGVESRGQK